MLCPIYHFLFVSVLRVMEHKWNEEGCNMSHERLALGDLTMSRGVFVTSSSK